MAILYIRHYYHKKDISPILKKYPIYEIQNFNCNSHKSDLYVNTFGNHLKEHSFIEEPHRHNFYLLVLFTKGTGIHDIDFDTFEINPGSLFVIQPGQIHNWKLSADIEGYIVFCSPEIYNLYFGNKKIEDYPFYQSAKNKPEIKLNETETIEIQRYFNLMILENEGNNEKKVDKLLNLLDIIHIEITRKYLLANNHAVRSYNHKINEFEKFLEQNYKSQKSPSFYASKMNITLKHLNRICREILDETATEIITKRVILEAKRMLIQKNKAISEIADELGYINYPYFTKLFKKQTGVTPTEFRNGLKSGAGL
jgi:AraC family transcriptional activator of pobA